MSGKQLSEVPENSVYLTNLSFDDLKNRLSFALSGNLLDFILRQEIGGESMKSKEILEIFYMYLKDENLFGISLKKLNKIKDNVGETVLRYILKVCFLEYYKKNKSSYEEKPMIGVPQAIYVETGRKEPNGLKNELEEIENLGKDEENLDKGFNDEEVSSILSSLNEDPNRAFESLYSRGEGGEYQIYMNIENFIKADVPLSSENKGELSKIVEKFMYKHPEICGFIAENYISDNPF